MGEDTPIDYDNLDIEELLKSETLHINSIITNIAIVKENDEELESITEQEIDEFFGADIEEFEALTEQEIDQLFEE